MVHFHFITQIRKHLTTYKQIPKMFIRLYVLKLRSLM